MDLKVNDVVIIDEIPDKNLNFLSGRPGVITQVLNSPARKSRGYIVRIVGLEEELEQEWFIDIQYVKPKNQ